MRPFAVLCALSLLAPATAFASIWLDSTCAATSTTADLASFAFAERWLDDNAADVSGHVIASRAAGNPFSYMTFNSSFYTGWEGEIDKLVGGLVPVLCRTNADSLTCAENTQLLGQTLGIPVLEDVFDGVLVCMDNIRGQTSSGDGFDALLTGVLAHEIMHHADMLEGHGPDGLTDANFADSNAEVVGLAVEHLVLGGELDGQLTHGAVSMFSPTEYQVDLDASVWNWNDHASEVKGISRTDSNPATTTCLTLDGATVQTWSTGQAFGVGSYDDAVSMHFAAYNAAHPVREIGLRADCGNGVFELDEANTGTWQHSTWVDLDLDVELSAAPVKHTAIMSTPNAWYDLTFQATITNTDTDTPSPATSVVVWKDDIFSAAPRSVSSRFTVPALNPGASTTVTFHVEAITSLLGSAPTVDAHLNVFVDDGAPEMHDRDLTNNDYRLTINSAWWKPDYRIHNLALSSDTSVPAAPAFGLYQSGAVEQGYTFAVVNRGPVAGTGSSFVTVKNHSGAELGRYSVPALAPIAMSSTYRTVIATPLCTEASYELSADGRAVIAENDEANNTAEIGVGSLCNLDMLDLTPIIDRGLLEDIVYGELMVDPILTAPWVDVQQIIEEMFELGSVGPFLPIDKIRAYTNTFVVAPDRVIRLSTYDARTTRALLGQQEIVGAGPGALVVPINGNVWTGSQRLMRPPGQ